MHMNIVLNNGRPPTSAEVAITLLIKCKNESSRSNEMKVYCNNTAIYVYIVRVTRLINLINLSRQLALRQSPSLPVREASACCT